MDLARAASKFTTSEIMGWNVAAQKWETTGALGRMQVYDRFITERTFGQKKRIVTVNPATPIPSTYMNYKLSGGSAIYLLESYNEDVANADAYGLSYLFHSTNVEVELVDDVVAQRASGSSSIVGESVVATFWADIERYRGESSGQFDDLDYTVANIAIPNSVSPDTSMRVRVKGTSTSYKILEVFDSLDLQMLKARKVA